MRVRSVPLVAALILTAAACSDDGPRSTDSNATTTVATTTPPATDPPATDPPVTEAPTTTAGPIGPGTIEWTDYEDGISDGYLEVPLDYADPTGPTINLYLARHAATDPANR
ncbi:MAG TPA: hypothetical protein DCR14_00090, partial [Acidimicrobiaceae bacterium]|nr:hypothetical protein [Acidimicrobiaceae bacterium]